MMKEDELLEFVNGWKSTAVHVVDEVRECLNVKNRVR
jgi:hypothetical protein